MTEIHEVNEFVHNLYEAEWLPLLGGIRGKSGVRGIPVGLEISENMGIDLIDMDPNTKFPLHTHPGSHILFVIEGKGTVTIGETTYITRPGDCYFVPAELTHGVGATEHHQILSIGFPHKSLNDPERMNIVDKEYQQQESIFASIYSSEIDKDKRQELLAAFQGKQQSQVTDNRDIVRAKLQDYLARFSHDKKLNIPAGSALDIDGLDSSTLEDFVLGFEKEFDITIDNSQLQARNFKTIGEIVDTIMMLKSSSSY
ncbi:MAG TPA: cupin domain-containing protein [Ktedonobacteraceae bacterium]|nr:cupin domain-containing protein [Ktedonobacteraceae bacterium]